MAATTESAAPKKKPGRPRKSSLVPASPETPRPLHPAETMPTANTAEAKIERQRKFLEVLEESISEKEALKILGLSQWTVRRWKMEPAFKDAYQAMIPHRMNNLEQGMYHVLDWALHPDNYEKVLRYPNLLIFALKGGIPEKYAERTAQKYAETQDELKSIFQLDDTPPVRSPTSLLPSTPPQQGNEREWFDKFMENSAAASEEERVHAGD